MTNKEKIYVFKNVSTDELILRNNITQLRDGWEFIGDITSLIQEREREAVKGFVEFFNKGSIINEDNYLSLTEEEQAYILGINHSLRILIDTAAQDYLKQKEAQNES